MNGKLSHQEVKTVSRNKNVFEISRKFAIIGLITVLTAILTGRQSVKNF